MGWRSNVAKDLANVRVLVVGAGGIGCELLKNLVLTGFKNIFVIDLDTIDVTNLNRQFLFRREHVGKSKAEVAVAAVENILPGVKIEYFHGSIFDDQFGVTFFKEFSIVMNALDNKSARTHVNRLCLAAQVPLIESGSAGFLGQVTTILRGKTECFECVPKPAQQKTFPGCTIRNTPSEHIHCTVWSKHLFNQLFGELDIDDDVSPDMNDENNKENGASDLSDYESSEENDENKLENEKDAMDTDGDKTPESTRVWAERVKYDPEQLFTKLFHDDIQYLLQMKNLWKERRAPIPFTLSEMRDQGCSSDTQSIVDNINKIWSGAQCVSVFSDCVSRLYKRKCELPDGEIMVWDKDDDDAMQFVAACANIRATIFGIPMKTLFDIKSMAGNIIPAIASTNAMVAGMMVIEGLKVVRGQTDKLRNVFITRNPNPRGKILMDEIPSAPNTSCFVCGDKRECFVRVNLKEMTLKNLEEKVLKGALNMRAPDVTHQGTSRIIISSEEGETDDLQLQTFADLKISEGSILDCDDFLQHLNLSLFLQNKDSLKPDEFEIVQDSGAVGEAENSEDKKETGKKRSLEDVAEGPSAKRANIEVD